MDLWEGLGPQSQTTIDEVVGVGTHPRSSHTHKNTYANADVCVNLHKTIYTYIYTHLNNTYLNIVYKMYIDIWVECLPFLFKWMEWHLTGRMLIQKSPSAKSRPCFCALRVKIFPICPPSISTRWSDRPSCSLSSHPTPPRFTPKVSQIWHLPTP